VNFVLTHLPHILPALLGFAFLAKFGAYAAKLPPAHLSDEELVVWRAEQARRQAARRPRPVSRAVARLGTAALPLLLAGAGTGLAIYTVDLRGDRPSQAMAVAHAATSAAGLLLVAAKIVRLPAGGLRRGLATRGVLREGSSLLLLAISVPLLATGLLLLVRPSSSSFTAYLHLVASVWWTLLIQWHLYRYLSRALRTTLARPQGRSAPAP
jgi:hypothetical protein